PNQLPLSRQPSRRLSGRLPRGVRRTPWPVQPTGISMTTGRLVLHSCLTPALPPEPIAPLPSGSTDSPPDTPPLPHRAAYPTAAPLRPRRLSGLRLGTLSREEITDLPPRRPHHRADAT